MAGKGFKIGALLAAIGCELIIPSFKQHGRFTVEESVHSRQVAGARIHVERLIGRMRRWAFLERRVPVRSCLNGSLDDAVTVIGFLTRFMPPLVADSAAQ